MEKLGWPRTVAPMLAKDAGTLRLWNPDQCFLGSKGFQVGEGGAGKDGHRHRGTGRGSSDYISQSHFSMNSGLLLTPLKQHLKGSRGMGEGSGRAEDALPFFSYFFVSSAKHLKPAAPQQ